VGRVRPVRIGLVGVPLTVARRAPGSGCSAPSPATTLTHSVDAFDGQADDLMAGGSPAASGDAWGVVPRKRWGRLHAGHTTRPWPSERGDWGDWTVFYSSFANAVRRRGAMPVDPWDAVAGLEVLVAAQRSAATGQVVALVPASRWGSP
jgi:predicted dehydrogenase